MLCSPRTGCARTDLRVDFQTRSLRSSRELVVNPTSGTPSNAFTFTITIKNVGHATTPNTASVMCLLDGQQLGETTSLANMLPNATTTITRTRGAGIVPWDQPHHIGCFADPHPPRVTEEREDNNSMTVPFYVRP